MVNNLFKISIALAVLTIWAGIITAAFAGGQKPIELGWVPKVWIWISSSGQQSTQSEKDPKSFVDEAKQSAQELGKLAKGARPPKSQEPVPRPSGAPNSGDLRLAACPDGSYDPQAKEVKFEQANIFKQKITVDKLIPKTLLTVQSYMGQPNCVIQGKAYVYLVEGNRVVRAALDGQNKPLKIEFTGF